MAPRSLSTGRRSSQGRRLSSNSRAQASEAQDFALRSDMDEEGGLTGETTDDESAYSTLHLTASISATNPESLPHSFTNSYRRPSFFTTGPRGTVVPHQQHQEGLSEREREQALKEERNLLSDNNVIPPGYARGKPVSLSKKISGLLSKSLAGSADDGTPSAAAHAADEESAVDADDEEEESDITERTALLGVAPSYGVPESQEDVDRKWEEAVTAGLIQTTWTREAKVLTGYSAPLMATFLLQYSLTVASIFTVGHLGKVELGAVSLASMTASITGYAVYQGLATSLDTLCAQAYGSGKKQLVGLQMQRMVYFLWVMTIPIGIIWLLADKILMKIVPEKDVAILAGRYLKVVLLGAPGYACFESGKRYVQAQGIFSASLYVLLICAPLNAFMNWLFVWVCFPLPKLTDHTPL